MECKTYVLNLNQVIVQEQQTLKARHDELISNLLSYLGLTVGATLHTGKIESMEWLQGDIKITFP